MKIGGFDEVASVTVAIIFASDGETHSDAVVGDSADDRESAVALALRHCNDSGALPIKCVTFIANVPAECIDVSMTRIDIDGVLNG